MTAHARPTDPWTSWAAANSIDIRPSQAAVLWLFDNWAITPYVFTVRQIRGMTLEQIVAAHRSMALDSPIKGPLFSDSRIRTAVAELIELELLVDSGYSTRTSSGRQARIIMKATPAPPPETLF